MAGLLRPGFGEGVPEAGDAPLQAVRHGAGARVQVRLFSVFARQIKNSPKMTGAPWV